MVRFFHLHNVSTGDCFFTGTLQIFSTQTEQAALAETLKASNMRLTHWNDTSRHGFFQLGPLGGIVVTTETIDKPNMNSHAVTKAYTDVMQHPIGEPVG